MCKAFSCLVTKSGKVYWQAGIDSHDELQSKFVKRDKELKDDKLPPDNTFARIEISPDNRDYIKPDKWSYHIDEMVEPQWLNQSYEEPCWVAFKKWYKKVYGQINLKELQNPINPFDINPPEETKLKHIKLLKEWDLVCNSVRDSVWASLRSYVRDSIRFSVWVSISVGDSIEDSVRDSVGDSVIGSVINSVGVSVIASVFVRDAMWAYISNSFPKIKNWKYIDKQKPPFNKIRGNPFRSAITLWKMGLVPSYDSCRQVWRLHGGKDARILFEIKKSDLEKI